MTGESATSAGRGRAERRKEERMPCRFPAHLSIVLPQETMTPFRSVVFVRDVSPFGAMVRCPADNDWAVHLREGFFCRLMADEGGQQARLFCRIAWMGRPEQIHGKMYVDLGLAYDVMDPVTARSIPMVLDRGAQTTTGIRFESTDEAFRI